MSTITDTGVRYGLVTRTLHWGMAILFALQFASAAAHWAFGGDNPLRSALWTYHYDLGAILFLLVMIRGAWGLANIPKRPPHSGAIGTAAVVGHVALYGMMVLVPFVRLLDAYGNTRPFSVLGVQIFAARDTEISWMTAPSAFHGEMGWILFALILGHILMATVYHRAIRGDGALSRMT